jgi:hypothetical protein
MVKKSIHLLDKISNIILVISIIILIITLLLLSIVGIDALIQKQTYINPSDYPLVIDYGILNEIQINTFNNILNAI